MITMKDVLDEVFKYKAKLELEEWELHVEEGCKDPDTYAEVFINQDYYKATINFNIKRIKTKKKLRKTVVHELWHIILAPYTTLATQLAGKRHTEILSTFEEMTVTRIERLNFW
jgi:hypothetical protein